MKRMTEFVVWIHLSSACIITSYYFLPHLEKGAVVYHNHVISSQLIVVDQVLYTHFYGFSPSNDRMIMILKVLRKDRNAIYAIGFV
jgi:hypothetical protein